MTTAIDGDTVVVSGEVTAWEAERFPIWKKNGDYYDTVDLTRAHFIEDEISYQPGMRMGHAGLVCDNRRVVTKRVNSLQVLLENLHVETVILPACVTRKQLNFCFKCEHIGQI